MVANCILGCNSHSEAITPLYSASETPHLEHCVQLWPPQFQKDIDILK